MVVVKISEAKRPQKRGSASVLANVAARHTGLLDALNCRGKSLFRTDGDGVARRNFAARGKSRTGKAT
jgi:hypothetical protein